MIKESDQMKIRFKTSGNQAWVYMTLDMRREGGVVQILDDNGEYKEFDITIK